MIDLRNQPEPAAYSAQRGPGHVLPLFLLALAGAVFGGRMFRLRRA